MIDVIALVRDDAVRQAQIDAEHERKAKEQQARAMGRALVAGEKLDKAQADGEVAHRRIMAAVPRAYQVDASVLYPAMFEHVQAILDGEAVSSPGEMMYRLQAMDLVKERPEAFEWAAMPRSEFEDGDERLGPRASALEICRKWFTRLLKEQAKPLFLHITDENGEKAYRLA